MMKSRRSCCCRPGCLLAQMTTFGLLAIAFVAIGLTMRSLILTDDRVDNLLCGKLCTPKPGDDRWATFVNSSADTSKMPLMYRKFWFFNLTNHAEVLNGSRAVVQEKGPYTFLQTTLRSDLTFSDDDAEVSFNQMMHYTFRKDLSCEDCDPDKDQSINLNPGVLAGLNTVGSLPPFKKNPTVHILSSTFFQQEEAQGGCPLFAWNMTNGAPITQDRLGRNTTDNANCMFGYGVPSQLPFAVESASVALGNKVSAKKLQLSNPLSLFHNYDNWAKARHALETTTYGLGGKCHLTTIAIQTLANFTRCEVSGNGTDWQWTVNTGRKAIADIGVVSKFLGNTSLNVWPVDSMHNPCHDSPLGPNCQFADSPVHGSNQRNFAPSWKNPGDIEHRILEVWNPTLMNAARFKFSEDVSHQSISAKRFTAYKAFPPSGMINGMSPSKVKLGMLAPLFFSRPYQFDVTANKNFDCLLADGKTSCEEGAKQLKEASRLETFIDVEPHTGAVIQGLEAAQINVRIDAFITSKEIGIPGTPIANPYTKVQQAYLPGLRFEVGAQLTSEVADNVRPGIRELQVATFLYQYGTVNFCGVGGLLFIVAILLGRKYVQVKIEERLGEMNQSLVNAEFDPQRVYSEPAAYSAQTHWDQ